MEILHLLIKNIFYREFLGNITIAKIGFLRSSQLVTVHGRAETRRFDNTIHCVKSVFLLFKVILVRIFPQLD